MSKWTSLNPIDLETGDSIEVATRASWDSAIRLGFELRYQGWVEVEMTPAEVQILIGRLRQALTVATSVYPAKERS